MAETAINTLLQTTVAMSVITGLLLLLLPWLSKRLHPRGIYCCLVILLFGYLIPWRPVLLTPAFTIPLFSVSNPAAPVLPPGIDIPADVNTYSPFPITDTTDIIPAARPQQILLLCWAVGAVAVLAFHLFRHYRFMRNVRRWSKPITNETFTEVLTGEMEALEIRQNIAMSVCSTVDTPMLVGFFRPVILLPDLDLDKTELRLVIRHELIHHCRRDLWIKALQTAILSIHWFNPLVYLLVKTTAFYSEASCDAEVVRDTDLDTRQYYSETIISVIRRQSNLRTALSTSFYGGKNGMRRRILLIMDTKRRNLGLLLVGCVLLITLGTGMMFTFGAGNPTGNQPSGNPAGNQQSGNAAAVDLTGKSENYRLISEMAALDRNMSIAEYNRHLDEICTGNGKEFFALVADVYDEINEDDPLHPYYSIVLPHSSSELFAENIGGSETSHFFGYAQQAKYGPDPVRAEHYSDAEWAFVQEQGPEIIYLLNANYLFVYDIADPNTTTVADRESRIAAIKTDMQTFIGGLSESELQDTGLESRITQEIERVSQAHNDNRIRVQGELQLVDYIGEIFE